MKVYNSDTLNSERKEAARKENVAYAFRGSMLANLRGGAELATRIEIAETVANLESLRYKVINSAGAPAPADVEALLGRFYLDVTRRSMEAPDLTSLIAREETNLDFPEIVYLRDILSYRGFMGKISGENDAVPLIEQRTGNVNTVAMEIKAIGWKDSIKNLLFNRFFTMDKVVQAAVDADVDERNKAVIGAIVGATYVASQKQAGIVDATATLDERYYATFVAAIAKLRGLLDPQTGKKINASSISWLGNSANTWAVENVIRGQLNGNGSSALRANRPALSISNVLEYDRGINDGAVVGKVTGVYPGVTAGIGYLFVPGVAIVANKRPLTMETGTGSVLELSTEERAWYRVQGTYIKDLLGSSNNPAQGGAAGYGAIIEVTLPT